MGNIIQNLIKIFKDLNVNDNDIRHLENKSLVLKEQNKNIGYDVFLEKDSRTQRQSYHIAILPNVNAVETVEHIKNNDTDLFKIDAFIYILRKQSSTSNTKSRIEDIFSNNSSNYSYPKPKSIDYIGEIIKKISISKSSFHFSRQKYTLPDVFIDPKIYEKIFLNEEIINTEFEATKEYIKLWVENPKKPILVILGKGGVGKTTLAEYFSNKILELNNNTSSVFINSIELRNRIKFKESNNFSLSLYDIYKKSKEDESVLDEYYFKQNLDCNNIFLIIDGIDEFISKVDMFDVRAFITSLLEYNQEINGLKIIITCRTEHWHLFENDNLQIVELQPFDYLKMESFFNRIYSSEKSKANKAIELAKQFHKPKDTDKEQYIYHPYVLETIKKILDKDPRDHIETKRLNLAKEADFIIASICAREGYINGSTRVTELSIDEQVKILEYLSITGGKIEEAKLHEVIFFAINKDLLNIQSIDYPFIANSFKTHPLLKTENATILFAFDFHSDIFKSIYIANNLKNENFSDELKNEIIFFLREFHYDSEIVNYVKDRINSWDDIHKINIQELVKFAANAKIDETDKKQILAGIFNLAFSISNKFATAGKNKIENTNLLKDLYININQINNLVLLNIDENIYFDFSDVYIFENCCFDGYKSFWANNIEWHKSVQFINCEFKNLGRRTSNSVLEWKIDNAYTYFDINSQKKMDEEFKSQFILVDEILAKQREDVRKLVLNFVQFFGRGGNFNFQNLDVETDKCKTPLAKKFVKITDLNLGLNDFLKICEDQNFIEYDNYNNNTKTVCVNNTLYFSLKKYLELNQKPKEVLELENKIIEFLNNK